MEVWAAVPLVHNRLMEKKGHQIWRTSDSERIRTKIEEIARETHTDEDARDMSRKERADEMFLDEFWSYGEIDIGCFAGILTKLKRIHGHLGKEGIGTFVDCGCGLGKTVLAAVLIHSWEKAMGVEGLNTLVEGAQSLLVKFQEVIYPTLSDKERESREELELQVARGAARGRVTFECSRSDAREKGIHALSPPRETIARPRKSQLEWKTTEV